MEVGISLMNFRLLTCSDGGRRLDPVVPALDNHPFPLSLRSTAHSLPQMSLKQLGV